MAITIYSFSATGNSMTTASRLADQLGAKLIPVASTKHLPKVTEDADTVGFVFPVYYGDMPYPVREMVSKMVFQPDTYVFICMTYRGHAGAAAKRMDQLLRTRGQKLSLAVGVSMPGNSFINPPEVDAEYLEKQAAHIAAVLPQIRSREVQDHFTEELLPLTPVGSPNNFRGIAADETCIGCGTCAQVCPMENIAIRDGRAVIGENCATCLACFHWCPVEAIWMSKQENIARRSKYHHPDVTLEKIAAQKRPE
ncbi:MAG: EFR1 family ferrodoxin [Clostridia bacterium]|nr:EFR1 family ferrodoxin [Clostridia bacterium]